MKTNAPRLRLNPLASAIALACTGATTMLLINNAVAQENVEEITVTGSRIQRDTSFTTAVPVTAVTTADLASFKPGATMADQLDQLPQFFQTQSAQRGGGALFAQAGRSVVDLRSMGRERTLVLLDGARLAPADRDGSVHIDNIPTALLSQVEVVTGGASAAYGADALAGVVNFRLNRDYEGLDFNVGYGATSDGQGDNKSFTLAYGTELGDKWRFIGSLENQSIEPIDVDPLELGDWFRRWGVVANPAYTPGNTTMPSRLVMPNVYSRNHTPAGKIGIARTAPTALLPDGAQVNTFNVGGLLGPTFNEAGTAVRAFNTAGATVGIATGNQSGGTTVVDGMTEAERANRAFGGGPYGAEVKRSNVFAGFTFEANESTRFFTNLLAGSTQSNDHDQRGIPHLASPWTTRIFRDNPYLPANVTQAMIAQGVDSFVIEKQGQYLNQAGQWGDHEERHNQYDGWTLQLGLDKDLGDNWQMQARIQRGSTDRFTKVFNEVRVDREMLAIDAVEVYNDRRDVTDDAFTGGPDGRPDLVPLAARGTGTIICNVQRYNPTEAQLRAAVAGVLVPAAQGDDSLGSGSPTDLVPIPSPVGPDAIPNCVPMNVLGIGNVSQAAADYVVSPKWGDSAVTQEFAEVLFTGEIWDGYGPGAFSMAVGATWREQWFWQRGQPQDLMRFGPPKQANNLGIRGVAGGFANGSPNLHEFSTVPTISGGYDVWELFTEFNMPLWASDTSSRRLELDVAGRHSDYSTSGGITSWKSGINFQAAEFLRLRATVSRDVREATFAERFDVQGGGGSITENAINNVPTPGGVGGVATTFQITSTNIGNPDLKPEIADTVTAGIVVEPADTGLQFSVDWYDIDLADAIGQLGVQGIVNECNASAGASPLCQRVFRDGTTNAVVAVFNPYLNINNARVRGIDYELLWNKDTDWLPNQSESLTLRFLAGRLLEDSTTTPTGTKTDLSGELSEPDFRALASVRYQIGKFGLNWQQRYMAETGLNGPGPITILQFVPGLAANATQQTLEDATVQSKMYTDLTFTYDQETSNGNSWQLSFAITNALDEDPPVIPTFDQRFSSQGNPANAYDVYGRRYLLNFAYRL